MEANCNNKLFTHLHVHTEYSLLDGSAKIDELLERCKELGMDSIAITDHGAMYGVIDFYKKAKQIGIKPIIGCEVYVAPFSRHKKENSSSGPNYYHLVLLAENNEGYQNLIKLVSFGFLEGFYYKPRIDLELLKKYHNGIIACSACLAGPVASAVLQVSYNKAKEVALLYDEIMGRGNFFLELQDHGINEQKTVNQALIKIHEETGIPMVCTNDSHYIYNDDNIPHDILLCIQTGKTINDKSRMRYEGSQFYLKSPEEMYNLFPYANEALENTYKIGQRCNVEITFHELKLPKFDVPDNKTAYDYLRELCFKGFEERYPDKPQELINRLEYELSTIKSMGYIDYFLIVWDFIRFAKEKGIMVGPGRGSAAGSIISYCLSITNIDPIKYDLIFERFLNPERISMPDIDIDFCYERRQEVIDYVVDKYGNDHVAQIITFGTLAARAAIKDVGRALAMPYQDVDKVSKMIPTELGITIKKALEVNHELSALYNEDENVHYLIDMSKRLEGLPRHSSTHAAGVVICRDPVMEYVPLYLGDGAITTQYTMTLLEELGILKMDFLGLRTLTVIQNAVKEIKRNYGIDIDLNTISYDDQNVYELISQGKTEGVFQLESGGMKQFMRELLPNCLEDLIAGISLYRPGPMEFIPKYVKGKKDQNNIVYTHSSLQPILNTTYGCIVYQEQVMQIVRDLAGYSMGRSDLVRRAMSKKKADVMAKERKNFVHGDGKDVIGCVKNGIPEAIAEKIFDEMTDFAKYAFNKSHAAAYAVVGYQTAWLKTYYPVEFMAALMTSVMDNTPKISVYIDECKKMGIKLLPPDINEGYGYFSVSDNKIRFGLAAIKNVGVGAIKAIINEREKNGLFKGLNDFCRRLTSGEINKRCIESFIKAGAFDSFGGNRAQYMTVYKAVLESVSQDKKNNIDGQISLFDIFSNDDEKSENKKDDLPNIPEYPAKDMLSMEKEVLGIYVSGHPLSEFEQELKKIVSRQSIDFVVDEETGKSKIFNDERVVVGGIIASKSIKYTKNGKPMAFIRLEDLKGDIEIVVFSKTYEKSYKDIFEENIIVVKGRASISEGDEPKIICESITPFEKPLDSLKISDFELWLALGKGNDKTFKDIIHVLKKYKGNTPVYIYDNYENKRYKTQNDFWVDGSERLIDELKNILGFQNVVIRKTKNKEQI